MNDKAIMAAKSITSSEYGYSGVLRVVDRVLIRMGYIVCEEDTSYARGEIEKIINYLVSLPGSTLPDDDFSYVEQKKAYIADKKPAPHAGARRSWAIHSAIVMQYMEDELKHMLRLRMAIEGIDDLICRAWQRWMDDLFVYTVLQLKKDAELIEWENEG